MIFLNLVFLFISIKEAYNEEALNLLAFIYFFFSVLTSHYRRLGFSYCLLNPVTTKSYLCFPTFPL